MDLHPVVKLFPRLSDAALKELADDIKENGLQEAIRTCKGRIIDGRNRLLACEQAGVEPRFVEWEGKSVVAYVLSMNARRRHLTPSQKAAGATNALPMLKVEAKDRQKLSKGRGKKGPAAPTEGEKGSPRSGDLLGPGKATEKAADLAGASRGYVEEANKLKTEALDLFEAVEAGDKTIPEAMRELKSRKKAAKPITFDTPYEDVGYAKWAWNLITGCERGCDYCSASDLMASSPDGFEPTFHADQLIAPGATKIPVDRVHEPGICNVLVCERGDLFGSWVAQEWIDSAIEAVRSNPQWTFIFMTKNPKRYLKIGFPENAWVGATADTQERAKEALEIFAQMRPRPTVTFLACVPLLEQINLGPQLPINWLILGARDKSSKLPMLQPEWDWVTSLLWQADASAKMPVYCMPNLQVTIRQTPVLA